MLYTLKKETGHERPKDKSAKNKKEIIPTPWNESPTHPLPNYPIPPLFIITKQWTQNSWYK